MTPIQKWLRAGHSGYFGRQSVRAIISMYARTEPDWRNRFWKPDLQVRRWPRQSEAAAQSRLMAAERRERRRDG